MSKNTAGENKREDVFSIRSILGPLLVIIIGAFMVMLDSTAMNVMVPRLILQFDSSYNDVQWVITGYLLAEAAVIPITGWMCDRFGMKPIFLTALGVFTVASLLCAFAQDLGQLVNFRVLQGLGGGMIIPIMFSYTYRLSPPNQAGKVMGIVVLPTMLAPALGPVLSGLMVDYISWHWLFVINVPIGVIALLAGILKLPVMDKQNTADLDFIGMFLAPIAFAGICYGISANAIGAVILGGMALVLFVFSQLYRKNPLLELRVFGSGSFTRGILMLWIAVFTQYGTLFLIPQVLQNAQNYSAFESGLIMLPYAIVAALSNQLGGRLFDKFGVRPVAIAGMGILAIAVYLFSRVSPDTGMLVTILLILLISSSVGLCVMPLYTHLLKVAPDHLVTRVSSLSSATQQVVVSFTIAGLASLLASRFKEHRGPGMITQVEAWSQAFSDTFIVIILMAITGILLGLTMRTTKAVNQKHESTKSDLRKLN